MIDLRYALRLARRQPGFTAGALLMLALGIGASSTMFAALHAVVLAPLPFERPQQLVQLVQANPSRGVAAFSVSLPTVRDWRARSRSFSAIAAAKNGTATVQALGEPEHLAIQYVSHDLLPLFGVHPALGRAFTAADDQPGAAGVALLSDGYWRRSFGADPHVAGRTISIEGRRHRVVGVLPPMILSKADLLLPLVPFEEDRRGMADLDVFARLKPNVTVAQASSEMLAVARQLEIEQPSDLQGWTARVVPLSDAVLGPRVPHILYILSAAVALLLLIVCANLSGLLLVRASTRTREMAVRAAIGGGRGRLVRQLLTESLLLAVAGGTAGVWLSYVATAVLRRSWLADLPRSGEIAVDGWVLVSAGGVVALTGVLAGLAPARLVFRLDVQRGLTAHATSIAGGGSRVRRALVVIQLALSIVLLAASGLTVRTLAHLTHVDLGFAPDHLLTAQVAPRAEPNAFYNALLDRLQKLPDVVAVGATSGAPMTSGNTNLHVYPVGEAAIPATEAVQCDWRIVTAGYFSAMNTPLLAGREFTPGDTDRAPKVVLVNETLARRLWGAANPIGRRVDLGGGGGEAATVVGLVGDVRNHEPGVAPAPTFYMSAYRFVYGPMTLVMRTSGDAAALLPQVRAEVRALDPSLALFEIHTMADLVRTRLAPERLTASLLTAFAFAALLLAGAGLYAVMSYATALRTREAALRQALGASRWDVMRPLIREGLLLAGAGAAGGLVAAVPASRLMRGLLTDLGPADPVAFAAATIVLMTVALLACYVPARRAARVSPTRALRGE